jgi:hypothetical protein
MIIRGKRLVMIENQKTKGTVFMEKLHAYTTRTIEKVKKAR